MVRDRRVCRTWSPAPLSAQANTGIKDLERILFPAGPGNAGPGVHPQRPASPGVQDPGCTPAPCRPGRCGTKVRLVPNRPRVRRAKGCGTRAATSRSASPGEQEELEKGVRDLEKGGAGAGLHPSTQPAQEMQDMGCTRSPVGLGSAGPEV